MSTLITLASFYNPTTGYVPFGGLVSDSAGNLFGTTEAGGANGGGTAFEIAKTGAGYASTPTTLVSFNGANGSALYGGLITDAAGDLFGTTALGGANNDGTVSEIVKTGTGYASTPITLASFSPTSGASPYGLIAGPVGGLVADAAGDLFGTTQRGGANDDGTVFEIAKISTGYASTPITLVSFNSTNGANPAGSLIVDAAGNLFGTTQYGGASSDGTVFEIAKNGGGYAAAPTTLVSFDLATNGARPRSSLITDAAGDLFGTTLLGGPSGGGTVFEIAKTGAGYAIMPIVLASFDGLLQGGLIADATGNLYSTTENGGPSGGGTVFEIAKTGNGYAAPATLVTFDVTNNGSEPVSTLIADAAGNLFGTTQYAAGNSGLGTVFEVTGGEGAISTLFDFTFYYNDFTANGADGGDEYAGTVADNGTFGYTVGEKITTPLGYYSISAIDAATPTTSAAPGTVNDFSYSDGAGTGQTYTPEYSGVVGHSLGSGLGNDSDFILDSNGLYHLFGGNTAEAIVTPQPGVAFSSVMVGDFNADGLSDLVFQRPADGATEILLDNPSVFTFSGGILSNPSVQMAGLNLVGVGDFNGDGDADLVFRNQGAATQVVQFLDGTTPIGTGAIVNPGFTPDWQIVGVGDFNGDNHADLVFHRASDGTTEIQFLNGTTSIGGGLINNPGFTSDWQIVGAGDFNGDGHSDLVFHNAANGATEIQFLNGITPVGGGLINDPTFETPDWQVVGVGDFNGDCHSDLVLHNTATNVTAIEFLNGVTPISGGGVINNPAFQTPDWQVVGVGDFNGDGHSDLVFRDAVIGATEIQIA